MRVITKVGIIGRRTEEILLSRVETVEIRQGILDRLFGMGNIKLTGTGSSELLILYVEDPIQIKKNLEEHLPR